MGVAPPGVAALLGAIVLFTIALIGGALWLAAEQAQRRSVLGGFAKVESVAAGFQWGLRFLSLMMLTLGLPDALLLWHTAKGSPAPPAAGYSWFSGTCRTHARCSSQPGKTTPESTTATPRRETGAA